MTTYITSLKSVLSSFAKASVITAALLVMILPSMSHAASYAYVNQSGNVSVVSATSWMAAIANAPGIAIHSGVILLDNLFGTSGLNANTGGI